MASPSASEADRLARAVLTRRLNLKPNENVTIETYPSSLPWAAGFVREARRLGARPLVHYEDEQAYWAAVEEGHEDVIGNPGSHEWAALANTDVYVYFWGPEDMSRANRLDEKTFGRLVAFNPKWYQTAEKAKVRGVRMGIARATEPNARFWGVPFDRWQKELVAASTIDPGQFVPTAKKVQRQFERGKQVHIHHPNGTDLSLRLVGRASRAPLGWVTPTTLRQPFGRMANVPDGSVYVAVDESTADGTLVANRMSGLFGEPVRGGAWTFHKGRLADQSYDQGSDSVRSAYVKGGKGRDRPSMLEVGLDPSILVAPNLEENERGAISVGVGGNAMFGGATKSGFVGHLTVAGAELLIDGKTVIRGGRIV